MSLFGGSKKPQEKTYLLLDIESGSVAAALVRVSSEAPPKLFGESRVYTDVAASRSIASITRAIGDALHTAAHAVSGVAARLRTHPATASVGTVSEVHAFYAAPFSQIDLGKGVPDFMPEVHAATSKVVETYFGHLPLVRHTLGGSLSFGARAISAKEPVLAMGVLGELTELAHVTPQGVRSYATVPIGTHTLVRTLRTHGNLSEAEARSIMRLPFNARAYQGPARAFAREFGAQVRDAARDLIGPNILTQVQVMSPQAADYFAQALVHSDSLSELFPQGGEVRALRKHHLSPYVAAHASVPDLPLMLHAIFVDQL